MHVTTHNPHQAAADLTSVSSWLAKPLEFFASTLAQDEYGIDIQKVQELCCYDTVTGITNTPEQIKPAPELGLALDTEYLIGLGMLDERMLILINLDRLMSSHKMGLIEKTLT